MKLKSNIVQIEQKKIYPAIIEIENKKIKSITQTDEKFDTYILCGFIDAHIHIESSMLVPSEFSKIAVTHGTVATVSDPHEIANVLGIDGVDYMIEDGKRVPLKFYFGAPSCVPATTFETSGAVINKDDIKKLLENADIKYLSEMMNFPGVIFEDKEVLAKLEYAKQLGKPIDGHAPALSGEQLDKYIASGITTDHEAYTYEEGLEKIQKGMKILLRQGSAAKNYEALKELIKEYPDMCMFCSDDRHPDDLVKGHINSLVKRSIALGYDLFDVLKIACINPIEHYDLDVGRLRVGDTADFIMVDNLHEFTILKTYIDGEMVFDGKKVYQDTTKAKIVNHFQCDFKSAEDFKVPYKKGLIKTIKALDGELITKEVDENPLLENNYVISDISRDMLKIAVINRYGGDSTPSIDFIEGFGLSSGAIASSIAHDSHNIIAIGCDDDSLAKAVNLVIKNKGAIVALSGDEEYVTPLNVAGLMSNRDGKIVADEYKKINQFVKQKMDSKLTAPFMTMSFMALLVIPELKLSDKGLFDAKEFHFTSNFV